MNSDFASQFILSQKEQREKSKKKVIELTDHSSLRESKYGKYVYYKTPTMKKPKFLSLKDCPIDVNDIKKEDTTFISVLVEWIHDKHNISV